MANKPLFSGVSGRMMIRSAPIVAYFFERDMRTNMAFFKTMIAAKNPDFMKRAFIQIMSWQNTSYPENLIHLHGSKDHTLPIRNIKNAQTLAGAGHWAIYVNAKAVSKVINQTIQ